MPKRKFDAKNKKALKKVKTISEKIFEKDLPLEEKINTINNALHADDLEQDIKLELYSNAIFKGDTNLLEYFINKFGVAIEFPNEKGNPLVNATLNSNIDIIRLITTKGNDSLIPYLNNALIKAQGYGLDQEIIDFLNEERDRIIQQSPDEPILEQYELSDTENSIPEDECLVGIRNSKKNLTNYFNDYDESDYDLETMGGLPDSDTE